MATRAQLQSRARTALDRRLDGWRQVPASGARPHGGWVRAIREALGMTAADLADRMGVSQSVVTRMEKSERAGRIQLDTLQRAAEALDCDLVYALVPRRSLDEMVTERARALAQQWLQRVAHTMALEAQAVDAATMTAKLERLTEQYRGTPGLWHVTRSVDGSRISADRLGGDATDGLG